MHAFIDLKMTDIHLERIGYRARTAGDLQAVDKMFEYAARRDASRHAACLQRNLGLDDFLGTDACEIQVQDLLAEMVPLDVANQHGFGGATDVEICEAPWCLDQPPDIVARHRDRHNGLLMPVNNAGNQTLTAKPAHRATTRALVLYRITRLDSNLCCVRHPSLAFEHPRDRAWLI